MYAGLFLPHGAPDLPLSDIPAAQFLRNVLNDGPLPKGIVMLSAHWETSDLWLTTAPDLETLHDFGGFSRALYALRYAAVSQPWLVQAVQSVLTSGGLAVRADPRRGLDHGAWVPLLLMRPQADIPVVQLSLPRRFSPQELFQMGRVLASLADQDILVIGSGATVHNLRYLMQEGRPAPDWATGFDDWIDRVLTTKDWPKLLRFQEQKIGRKSHPTPEHFLPLIVVAGMCDARPQSQMHNLHRSYSYGAIGMAAWGLRE